MPHRSHLTAVLTNYFDATDTRTREHPWTLEAQLLNGVACSLEESEARVAREIAAVRRGQTPLNLDNRGLWYRAQLPYGVSAPSRVVGVRAGVPVDLQPYDDYLPLPSGVEADRARSIAAWDGAPLFALAGDSLPGESGPLALAIPNTLYVYVSGLGDYAGAVELAVEGHRHPRTYWASASAPVTEILDIPEEGCWATGGTWESIVNLTVRNLPAGAALEVHLLPMRLPFQPDPGRPFTDPALRESQFPRAWRVRGQLLEEIYFAGRFAGQVVVQAYYAGTALRGLAVEPYTPGLLAASSAGLHYLDRREPVPEGLARAALTEEPLYGLEVSYDATLPGDRRHVVVTPVAYAAAANLVQWRYWVQAPDGEHWALTPAGELAPYASNLGWARGVPPAVRLALPNSLCGTWLFALETIDRTGHRASDRFPYLHAAFDPLAVLDTSSLVPQLDGVAFDSRARLWLWSAGLLVPARLRYDAYVYDAASNSLFLTEKYDELRLD